MKKRLLPILLGATLLVSASLGLLSACSKKHTYFEQETTFHLDLTMPTPLGPLGTVCHPGTLVFQKNGKVKMNVTFTETAYGLMDNIIHYRIPDFVHDDTYELNAERTVITYHPTRDSFNGEDIVMDIERLSDNSMKIAFDIGAVIPNTVLTFYSNEAMMPSGEPDEPESYDVTFKVEGEELEPNSETSTLPEGASYAEVTEITLPELEFSNGNKIFRGWAPNGARFEQGGKYLYQPGESYTVESDIEFVAVWDKDAIVTLLPGEMAGAATTNTSIATETTIRIPAGIYLYLPANPFRVLSSTGKGFAYWLVKGGDGKAQYPGKTLKITEDTALTAVWKEYTEVTFAPGTNGVGEEFKVKAPVDSVITFPENPYTYSDGDDDAANDKGFRAWREPSKPTTNREPGYSYTVPEGGATVTAFWDSFVTASFAGDGGNGSVEAIKVVKGVKFALPDGGFTKDGKVLVGWLKGTTKYGLGTSTTISADTEFTANWKDPVTLSFEGGEGATGTMQPIVAGETMKISLPECGFTNAGKKFDGWSDGTKTYKAGASYTVGTANVTFTAQWQDGQFAPYTVTFRAKQAGVSVGPETTLDALMLATEIVIRPDLTADYVIKFKANNDLKKVAEKLGVSISSLRAKEVEYRNVPYRYDPKTSVITLDVGNGETIQFTVSKAAKDLTAETPVLYDTLKISVPFEVGSVTSLEFSALDGKPAYVSSAKTFKGKVDASAVGFGELEVTLNIAPNGTGSLKASFLTMTFFHMFNEDYSAIIWLGDSGDHIDGTVATNESGKMVVSVTLLGHTVSLTEV